MKSIPILGYDITFKEDPQLEGITYTIYFCGCPHKCSGCHNKDSWDINNATLTDIEEIEKRIDHSSMLVKSVCFCGGEPLLYPKVIKQLTDHCHNLDLKVILYTGYLFEEIDEDIINKIDIIIDGPYIENLSQLGFPSSTNQRVFTNGKQIQNANELRINFNI